MIYLKNDERRFFRKESDENVKKQLNMIYVLNNNELVHVSKFPSDLKCECFCPACNAKLVAMYLSRF